MRGGTRTSGVCISSGETGWWGEALARLHRTSRLPQTGTDPALLLASAAARPGPSHHAQGLRQAPMSLGSLPAICRDL